MKLKTLSISAASLLVAMNVSAVTINFDDLTAGDTLSNQYAAMGVTFSANGLAGANTNSTPSGWATNSDMTIVSATGSDVGGLGTPSLVSGLLLRSFSGWLSEDGDPSFLMSFSTPLTSVSVTFAGVSNVNPGDTALLSTTGAVLVAGSATTGQFVLTYSNATPFSSIVVAPGSFSDWVGVDNITLVPIPEPGTYAMMALGLAGLMAWKRRQQA